MDRDAETRAVAAHVAVNGGTLTGYAAVFNEEATIASPILSFREVVRPGTFARALRQDVILAFNHSDSLVLARTGNHTLQLHEDSTGLRYVGVLPNTTAAKDVRALIAGGYIRGSSFRFTLGEQDSRWDDSGLRAGRLPLHIISSLTTLIDVGPVTWPAYEGTTAEARGGDMRHTAAQDGARVPARYKDILRAVVERQHCARCGRHVGTQATARGAHAFHADCARDADDEIRTRHIASAIASRAPAALARRRDARRLLNAARRVS